MGSYKLVPSIKTSKSLVSEMVYITYGSVTNLEFAPYIVT